MIKSRSIGGIRTTKSSNAQKTLNLDSQYQPSEDYALDSIRYVTHVLQSTPQSCSNNPLLVDKTKKKIKLRVNNNFPSDFFENPSGEVNDNKVIAGSGIPVKLVQHATPKHVKTINVGDAILKTDIRNFSPQLLIACSPVLREERGAIRKVQWGFESERIRGAATNFGNQEDRSCSIENGPSDSGLTRMKIRPFLDSIKTHTGQVSTNYTEQSDVERSQSKRKSLNQKPLLNMLRNDSLADLKRYSHRGSTILIQDGGIQENTSRPLDSTKEPQCTSQFTLEESIHSYSSSRQATRSKQHRANMSPTPMTKRQKSQIIDKSPKNILNKERVFDFVVPNSTRTYRTITSRESNTLPVLSPVRVYETSTETMRTNGPNDVESVRITEVLQENRQEAGQRIVSNKALMKFHKSIIKPINIKSIKFGPALSSKSSISKRIEHADQEQEKENINGMSVITPLKKNRKGEITEQKPNNNQAGEGLTHSVSVKGLEFSFSHETQNNIEGFSENLIQKVMENKKTRPKIVQRQINSNGQSINLGSQNKGIKLIKIQKRSSLVK